MIEALINGKLGKRAEELTGRSGRSYVKAQVRVPVAEGESITIMAIAFDETPARALLALAEGDALAVAGTFKPTAWTDRDGNPRPGGDLIAGQVLTLYGLARRRKAAAGEPEHQEGPSPASQQHQERRQRQQDPVQRDLGDIGPQDWPGDSGGKEKAPWD